MTGFKDVTREVAFTVIVTVPQLGEASIQAQISLAIAGTWLLRPNRSPSRPGFFANVVVVGEAVVRVLGVVVVDDFELVVVLGVICFEVPVEFVELCVVDFVDFVVLATLVVVVPAAARIALAFPVKL